MNKTEIKRVNWQDKNSIALLYSVQKDEKLSKHKDNAHIYICNMYLSC